MPAISRMPNPTPAIRAATRWPANGFHQRLRGVDADQHQHEQEQHHHRAGVDDHLHHAQEQRVLGHVEHARLIIVAARKIAEYTALGAATTPIAPATATTASTQNATASAVECGSGFGRQQSRSPGHSLPTFGAQLDDVCPGSSRRRWRPRPSGAAAPACRAAAGPAACPCRRSGRSGCRRPSRTRWSSSARGWGRPRCTDPQPMQRR